MSAFRRMLLAALWISVIPAALPAAEPLIRLDLPGRTLEGTPLAASEKKVLFLARDGQLAEFAPEQATNYSQHRRRLSQLFAGGNSRPVAPRIRPGLRSLGRRALPGRPSGRQARSVGAAVRRAVSLVRAVLLRPRLAADGAAVSAGRRRLSAAGRFLAAGGEGRRAAVERTCSATTRRSTNRILMFDAAASSSGLRLDDERRHDHSRGGPSNGVQHGRPHAVWRRAAVGRRRAGHDVRGPRRVAIAELSQPVRPHQPRPARCLAGVRRTAAASRTPSRSSFRPIGRSRPIPTAPMPRPGPCRSS